jgi:hypothetical protein
MHVGAFHAFKKKVNVDELILAVWRGNYALYNAEVTTCQIRCKLIGGDQ